MNQSSQRVAGTALITIGLIVCAGSILFGLLCLLGLAIVLVFAMMGDASSPPGLRDLIPLGITILVFIASLIMFNVGRRMRAARNPQETGTSPPP